MSENPLANLAEQKRRDAEALERVQGMVDRGEINLSDLIASLSRAPSNGAKPARAGSIPAHALEVLRREGRAMKAKDIAQRVRECGLDSEDNTIINALYRAAKKRQYVKLVGPSEFAAM